MAIVKPTWWGEAGKPEPTPPKNKVKKVKTNPASFGLPQYIYDDLQWHNNIDANKQYAKVPMPPPVEMSPGQFLYEKRLAKTLPQFALHGTAPWNSCDKVTKSEWEDHAQAASGKHEKWCYDNNKYVPFMEWVGKLHGPTWGSTFTIRPTRKIRVINRPGTIEV